MFEKLYDWLKRHPYANILILISYYVLVVLPHEWLGARINALFKPLGREQYNCIIAALTMLIIIILAVVSLKRWKAFEKKKEIIPYILGSMTLLVICFKILFVINIEVVHIPQYAVFAVLAYPLFQNIISVMFMATSFGILDELYQYLALTPHINKYFDFNDVFIDQIGAGIGLIAVILFGWHGQKNKKPIKLSDTGIVVFALLIFIFVCGYILGVFSIYDPNGTDIFTLIKEQPSSYWTIPKGPPAIFHILSPLEGIVSIIVAFLFYGSMQRL